MLWLSAYFLNFFSEIPFSEKKKSHLGDYISNALRVPSAYAYFSLNLRYKLLNQLVVSLNFTLGLVYRPYNNTVFTQDPVQPSHLIKKEKGSNFQKQQDHHESQRLAMFAMCYHSEVNKCF